MVTFDYDTASPDPVDERARSDIRRKADARRQADALHAEPHPVLDGGWLVAMRDDSVRYVMAATERKALRAAARGWQALRAKGGR